MFNQSGRLGGAAKYMQGDCHTVSARLSLFLLPGFPSRLRPVLLSPSAPVCRGRNAFISGGIGHLFKVGFGELCLESGYKGFSFWIIFLSFIHFSLTLALTD